MGLAEARVPRRARGIVWQRIPRAPISRHLLMADVVSQAEALLSPAAAQPTGLGPDLSAGRPGGICCTGRFSDEIRPRSMQPSRPDVTAATPVSSSLAL